MAKAREYVEKLAADQLRLKLLLQESGREGHASLVTTNPNFTIYACGFTYASLMVVFLVSLEENNTRAYLITRRTTTTDPSRFYLEYRFKDQDLRQILDVTQLKADVDADPRRALKAVVRRLRRAVEEAQKLTRPDRALAARGTSGEDLQIERDEAIRRRDHLRPFQKPPMPL